MTLFQPTFTINHTELQFARIKAAYRYFLDKQKNISNRKNTKDIKNEFIDFLITWIPPVLKNEQKRKEYGIFYTDQHITTYIIENTLGKLCTEKKTELGIAEYGEWETENGKKKAGRKSRNPFIEKLDEYREWLLSLTICDPACGSGAFLNAVLDFLKKEHLFIDEMIAKVEKHKIVYSEYEIAILENNLYGVDINEESVEITQLALWLRTAKPNRKLNFLDNNIKLGNSLVSPNETTAGSESDRSNPSLAVGAAVFEKAFDWHKEFPHVFAKGGFDIVIGNPPYVRFERIPQVSKSLAALGYRTYNKRGDIHCVFVERGIQLLKQSGYISYIMPNKWMQTGYGKPLREFLLTIELNKIIDIGVNRVFADAGITVCIFVAKNSVPKTEFIAAELKPNIDFEKFADSIIQREETFRVEQFGSEAWVISSQRDKQLQDRLNAKFKTLSDFVDNQAFYGIKTGLTEAFLIDEQTKRKIIKDDPVSAYLIKPFLRGREIYRYDGVPIYSSLIILEKGFTLRNCKNCDEAAGWKWLSRKYPGAAKWLEPFADKCKNRIDQGDFWWELRACDYYSEFAKPKIMYQRFQRKPCFIYDESGMFCNDSIWMIPTKNKALLAILNSQLGWWLITTYCSNLEGMYQLLWDYFGRIPIPSKLPKKLEQFADKMLLLHSDIETRRRQFLTRMSDNFDHFKITGILERFDELEFSNLLAELKKQRILIPIKNQQDWREHFTSYQTKCREITKQIAETDQEIDQLVYQLYGLTDDEIEIVEK
jgi:type I restriction-modification system DNA methylase subunit